MNINNNYFKSLYISFVEAQM